MFSPLAFPGGVIIYDFTLALPPTDHLVLSPFETYREPMLVIGVADAQALHDHHDTHETSSRHLESAMFRAIDDYSRALLFQLLVFDHSDQTLVEYPPGTLTIPPVGDSRSTTIKTIMCDISAKLLSEMVPFARSIQEMPFVVSPSSVMGDRTNGISWRTKSSAELQRSNTNANSRSASPTPLGEVQRDRPHPMTRTDSQIRTSLGRDGSRSSSPAYSISQRDSRTATYSADSKTDRKSTLSGSLTERTRARVTTRQGLLIGALYLHSGRWSDALRELTEHTNRAKVYSDHLWHAKGLENILITLILLAWAGADFQIPPVCYAVTEKSSSNRHSSGSNLPFTTTNEASRQKSLEALSVLIPDLTHMILSIHARAANFDGEAAPQLSYSETVIRFSHLMTVLHHCRGLLDLQALNYLVFGGELKRTALEAPSAGTLPTKRSISDMLFRASPPKAAAVNSDLANSIVVFSGMISVLSMIGLQRKRAMVIKELLTALIPGLIQAKKLGAAEIGIHPEASSALQYGLSLVDKAQGLDHNRSAQPLAEYHNLLDTLCGLYSIQKRQTGPPLNDSDSLLIDTLLDDSSSRASGAINLKSDILRLCIRFCEALPDFASATKFMALLLKTAGPGGAPDMRQPRVTVRLSREEQNLISTKLQETSTLLDSLDSEVFAAYWDYFLIRDVRIVDMSATDALTARLPDQLRRTSSYNAAEADKPRGPFIHDAIEKASNASATDIVLVAGEPATLMVRLQNMFAFDVIIDELCIISQGNSFSGSAVSCVLGPHRFQEINISGIVRDPGQLVITGCGIRIRGCRKQDFPIFRDSWSPDVDMKLKHYTPNTEHSTQHNTNNDNNRAACTTQPMPVTVSCTVLPAQPKLSIMTHTMPQSGIVMLEGECRTFTITLRNTSKIVVANLVHVTFGLASTNAPDDPAEEGLDSAIAMYESDERSKHRPSYRWLNPDNKPHNVEPQATTTLTMQVHAHAGLAACTLHIDYAHLSQSIDEITGKIYTRRISLPINLSVTPTLQLRYLQVLPLTLPPSQFSSPPSQPRTSQYLLLLDLHNTGIRTLSASLSPTSPLATFTASSYSHTQTTIPPSTTHRLLLPLPTHRLTTPHAPIPLPTTTPTKQFLYNPAAATNSAARLAALAAFWHREELLRAVRCEWRVVGPDTDGKGDTGGDKAGRSGVVDLRASPQWTQAMVAVARSEDVSVRVRVHVEDGEERDHGASPHQETATSPIRAPIGAFVRLTAEVTAYADVAAARAPLVRFRARLRGAGVDVDVARHVAWSGQLEQRVFGGEGVVEVGVVFLSAGGWEVCVVVEEGGDGVDGGDGIGDGVGRRLGGKVVVVDAVRV